MVTVREDMTGWNMWEHGVPDSRLTVIQRTDDYIQPNGKHIAQWICRCNCENQSIITVKGSLLRYGETKSCGCLQKEIAANMCKQRNVEHAHPLSKDENLQLNLEDEHGLYGIGHCHNTGREFYFDMGDYDLIKDYCWTESKDYRCDYYYLRAYDAQTQKILVYYKYWVVSIGIILIGIYLIIADITLDRQPIQKILLIVHYKRIIHQELRVYLGIRECKNGKHKLV